jgi:hypothetical protein
MIRIYISYDKAIYLVFQVRGVFGDIFSRYQSVVLETA